MIVGLGFIVIIGAVIAVVVLAGSAGRQSAVRSAPGPSPQIGAPPGVAPSSPPRGEASADDLGPALDRWVAAGLLDRNAADTISAFEVARAAAVVVEGPPVVAAPAALTAPAAVEVPRRRTRLPVVAEALGYIGGALALAGIGLILGHAWPDLSSSVRFALAAGAALVLSAGGALIPHRHEAALERLRGAVWLAGTASAGLAAGVLARAVGVESDEGLILSVSATVAALSAVLWAGRPRALQQLTALGGLLVSVGVGVSLVSEDLMGIAVWVVAVGLVALGLLRRTSLPTLTEVVGLVGAFMGSVMVASSWGGLGLVFAAVSSLTVVGVAIGVPRGLERIDRLLLGILGAVMVWMTLPGALGYFAQDAGLVTGLIVWSAGAALLVLGGRRLSVVPLLLVATGGVAVLVGAAVTGVEAPGLAPLLGIATAVGLIVLGTRPGWSLLSIVGSVGLLANVPWAISHYLPGEGRVPVVIMVSGILILVVAVVLARSSGRLRHELTSASPAPSEPPLAAEPAPLDLTTTAPAPPTEPHPAVPDAYPDAMHTSDGPAEESVGPSTASGTR